VQSIHVRKPNKNRVIFLIDLKPLSLYLAYRRPGGEDIKNIGLGILWVTVGLW